MAEMQFGDADWYEVVLDSEPGRRRGVLTVQTGRTWSPAWAGVSAAARELGAAVTRVKWPR